MKNTILATAAILSGTINQVLADPAPRPDSHAPIGVMGDHLHAKGEWMLSYRFMTMSMDGNRDGSSDRSAEQIATTAPNGFFGLPMQPPTLRVVPTEMTMEMHMVGLMYAPTDRVTLMLMANYLENDMEHVTFAGPMGDTVRGTFSTSTSGWGDASLSALIGLYDDGDHRLHATVGATLPFGDIDQTDQILAPTGATPSPRLPYPMQLGSDSVDPILGLTYAGFGTDWSWGAQWRSVLRVDTNDEGYRLGDEHTLSGWLAYRFSQLVSGSVRLTGVERGNISGQDSLIVAPVQTADPNRQGRSRLDLGLGTNFLLRGHRIALEASVPVLQHLDGPQLETDWSLQLGYQRAF